MNVCTGDYIMAKKKVKENTPMKGKKGNRSESTVRADS